MAAPHLQSSAALNKAWRVQQLTYLAREKARASAPSHPEVQLDILRKTERSLEVELQGGWTRPPRGFVPQQPSAQSQVASALVATRQAIADHKDEHEPEHRESPEEREKPVPVINTFKLEGEMDKEETVVGKGADGELVMSGSEYLGTAVATAATQPGTSLFSFPVCPAYLQGSRLGAFANLYDLWSPLEIIFEYIPLCPSSTGGAVVGYSQSDVFQNAIFAAPGAAAVRDAVSRPGACVNQIFEKAAYVVTYPQQSTYFTRNNDNPNLNVAGEFNLLPVNTINPGAVGMLWMHYKVAFYQPTVVAGLTPAPQYPAATFVAFNGIGVVAFGAFFVGTAAWSGITWNRAIVGKAVIQSFTDPGAGVGAGGTWRTVYAGESAATVPLLAGMPVYFRTDKLGTTVLFYPSLGAAIMGGHAADNNNATEALESSITGTLAVGCAMTFEQIVVWTLPDTLD